MKTRESVGELKFFSFPPPPDNNLKDKIEPGAVVASPCHLEKKVPPRPYSCHSN